MRKIFFCFLLNSIIPFYGLFAQNNVRSEFSLNLDFEQIENGVPVGWNNNTTNNYKKSVDSLIVKSGKYSVSIEYVEGDVTFMSWTAKLPHIYEGKNITLSGYIKTENVSEGYAGLWMRIDPGVAFSNMSGKNVSGTNDWTQFSITLKMKPEKSEQIYFGGLLAGKGKIWMDDLKITIDSNDITEAKIYEQNSAPFQDMEFDNGSAIKIDSLTDFQIENIKTLGLIWGFLKYYHPNIAKGEFNWDYELFRILPKILNVSTVDERDKILVSWINSFGKFKENQKKLADTDYVKIKPDLDWIKSSDFSSDLVSSLEKVRRAKRDNSNFYFGLALFINNPEFTNEKAYSDMVYPDDGFRILSLYRYWNIIQYLFPYKNLIGEDWKTVLEEFIPKFVYAGNETEYQLVVLELIARIHDTHANVWGGGGALYSFFGKKYSAAEIKIIENKPVVTGFYNEAYAKETGLQKGDIITMINDKSPEDIISENLKYTPASNYPTQLRNLARNILRSNDSSINVEFTREGKEYNAILKTYSLNEIDIYRSYKNNDTCFKLINDDIAYLNNGTVKSKYLPELWKYIENTKGLIIDVRNYPSEFIIYKLSNYLLPEPTDFVKFTSTGYDSPGLFKFGNPNKAGSENKNYYKGKVVIIVNEVTQSSAEFHTMAYRTHPNATVIGSTTAGADGDVSEIYLPGGIRTMISGIGIYYPDGTETQRTGIVPDIEVKPTINGIKEGRDELLEKAIEIINKN